jgi:adenosylcobinamide-GDP ribazoletransferase
LNRFLSVFSLVSRIPVPIRFAFDPSRMDFHLPLVGLPVALVVIAAYAGSFFVTGSRLLAVVLAVLAQYLCFNLFHLDGLADTADAFLGNADKERTFAILKDSRVGVYGMFAGVMSVILKTALLYALVSGGKRYGLLGWTYPIAGRFAAALIPCICRPAKDAGLGALARGSGVARSVAGWGAASIAGMGMILGIGALGLGGGGGIAGVCATGLGGVGGILGIAAHSLADGIGIAGGGGGIGGVCATGLGGLIMPCGIAIAVSGVAAVVTASFYATVHKKRIDGYTGDALGAAVETAEAVSLLIAVAIVNRL